MNRLLMNGQNSSANRSKLFMCSESDKSVVSSEVGGRRLRLVKEVSEKKATQLTESNAKELRELIEEVQRKTPRKKNEDNDLLPPAA